jgi:hypothetical protein
MLGGTCKTSVPLIGHQSLVSFCIDFLKMHLQLMFEKNKSTEQPPFPPPVFFILQYNNNVCKICQTIRKRLPEWGKNYRQRMFWDHYQKGEFLSLLNDVKNSSLERPIVRTHTLLENKCIFSMVIWFIFNLWKRKENMIRHISTLYYKVLWLFFLHTALLIWSYLSYWFVVDAGANWSILSPDSQ